MEKMIYEISLANGETINIVVAVETENDEQEENELLHLYEEYHIAQTYDFVDLVKFEKCN